MDSTLVNNTLKKGIATGATILALGGGAVGADTKINPYEDKGTHQELSIKHEIPQRERVEISKDKAEMTLKGWNDEYAIKVIPQIPSSQLVAINRPFTSQAKRPFLSKKIKYKEGDVTAFIEPKNDTDFDIDFTLDKKPDTNVFEYKIEGAEEFDFWYQPELTAQEIAEGADRPENVVGSYAVYHKEKANHKVGDINYATGKVFHIYRPKAIDAKNKEVWAELLYNDGILSVKVPQDFLDTAKYPVVVDPTFGYTTVGGTKDGDVAQTISGSLFSAPENGTITSLTTYVQNQSGSIPHNVKAVILDSSRAIVTNGVGGIAEQAPATTGWVTATYSTSPLITNGTSYFVTAVDDNSFMNKYSDNTGGVSYVRETNNYATPTNPATTLSGKSFSVYATYTASGGGATPPKQDVIWFE